jgi:hypothetical protein
MLSNEQPTLPADHSISAMADGDPVTLTSLHGAAAAAVSVDRALLHALQSLGARTSAPRETSRPPGHRNVEPPLPPPPPPPPLPVHDCREGANVPSKRLHRTARVIPVDNMPHHTPLALRPSSLDLVQLQATHCMCMHTESGQPTNAANRKNQMNPTLPSLVFRCTLLDCSKLNTCTGSISTCGRTYMLAGRARTAFGHQQA